MVFSSVIFLFYFIPIFFALYYIVPFRWKNYICLAFSLFFYAWGEPRYILLMLASILVNYLFGLGLGFGKPDRTRKLVLILSCIFNIAMLAVFKYASFFVPKFLGFIGSSLKFPHIVLPLGISFYTFQAMSYVFDVYRKQSAVQKNPLNLALYISMFPQLVAGPIVRYDEINEEIDKREIHLREVADGIFRFTIGLGKKVLIANTLGALADAVWATKQLQISTLTAWIGVLAYTLQIYFDFGGYSDMAIGLGSMLGFHFSENFHYPYISRSVSEFWRRWHISLGSWFRDYLYFPLGGSRVRSSKKIRNLLVVWTITGLWHGANWTFLVWGLYYGVLICLEKTIFPIEKLHGWKPLKHVVTLLAVVLGWVLFRSDTIAQAGQYLQRMLGIGALPLVDASARTYLHDNWRLLLVACIGCTPLIRSCCTHITVNIKQTLIVDLSKSVAAIVLLVLCMIYLVNATYNPFIYFRF